MWRFPLRLDPAGREFPLRIDPCSNQSPSTTAGECGVIDMELLSVIRRWRYRRHCSIREIARRAGLSRNTVRKYLRADSVEPKFQVAERASKLDPYADKLSHMLRQETARQGRRLNVRPHEDPTARGEHDFHLANRSRIGVFRSHV